jgi:hypothetical protein
MRLAGSQESDREKGAREKGASHQIWGKRCQPPNLGKVLTGDCGAKGKGTQLLFCFAPKTPDIGGRRPRLQERTTLRRRR